MRQTSTLDTSWPPLRIGFIRRLIVFALAIVIVFSQPASNQFAVGSQNEDVIGEDGEEVTVEDVDKAGVDPVKPEEPPKNVRYQKAVLIEFQGPINPFLNQLFQRKLAKAKKMGADLIVVEIHSPGGTVDDSIEIAKTLRDVDWAHTVAWIPEKALSGAALASLGCDEIVMSGNSRIGDAGVIFLDNDFFFKYAVEKIRSDVVRQGRDLAESKGRSPDIVEAMIDMDVLVFQKELPDGSLEFASRRANQVDSEDDADDEGGKQKKQAFKAKEDIDLNVWKLVPESDEKKFLIINGPRAVEIGFAQRLADNREELAEEFGLTNDFQVLKRNTSDTAAWWLNRWWISILLLAIGVIALLVELSAPGISVGGIIAMLCFVLFFWARFLGGTAGGLEVVLFLLGILFLLMELFVIPGFGVPGLLGLFLLVSSVILASQDFVIPSNSQELTTFSTGLLSILGVGVLSLVGGVLITRYLGDIPILHHLVLAPPDSDAKADESTGGDSSKKASGLPKPDHFPSIGEWGVSESVLRPSGKAKFGSQTHDVVADGFVDGGVPVRVMSISGNVIRVTSDA